MTDYSVKLNAMSDGGGFNWGTVSLTLITFEELGRNVGTFNKLWRTVGKFRELWGTVGNPCMGALQLTGKSLISTPGLRSRKTLENLGKCLGMLENIDSGVIMDYGAW